MNDLPQDHPVVKAWISVAYKAGPGGLVVVPIACMVTLKNGKSYGMPKPPKYVAPHLRRNGTVTYSGGVVPSYESV